MKKAKKIIAKLAGFIPALAFLVGFLAANSACTSFYYQPEVPEAMNAFRK